MTLAPSRLFHAVVRALEGVRELVRPDAAQVVLSSGARTAMAVRQVLRSQRVPARSPHRDAQLLMDSVGLSAAGPRVDRTSVQFRSLVRAVAARARGVPIAYLTGHRAFYAHDFIVNRHVLVPRPATETLVSTVVDALVARASSGEAPLRVLELGVGSGCVLVSVVAEARARGAHVTGLGVDSSRRALRVAARNVAAVGVPVTLVTSDWTSGLGDGGGRFDAIVSNPPYLASWEVGGALAHEPRAALDGGHDGLDAYRALASDVAALARWLAPGGLLALETGSAQAAAVRGIFCSKGWVADGPVVRDLDGWDRVLVFRRPAGL